VPQHLVVGQLIKVLGPTYATYNGADYKAGWFSRIVSIAGTTVTLQHPAPATFTASAIKCWKATEDVNIQDLKIDSRGRTGGFGMSAQYAVNVLIQRCIAESDVSGGLVQGIRLIACLNSKITNSLAYGLDMTHVDAPGFAVEGHNDSVMYCTNGKRHDGYILSRTRLHFYRAGYLTTMRSRITAHGQALTCTPTHRARLLLTRCG
jgi:hypothetical protein